MGKRKSANVLNATQQQLKKKNIVNGLVTKVKGEWDGDMMGVHSSGMDMPLSPSMTQQLFHNSDHTTSFTQSYTL